MAEKGPGKLAGEEQFKQMTDEQLVAEAEGNDDALEFLMRKYKNYVRAKASPYFLVGADREDIVQEGMIGLYKAVRDFDSKKNATFRGFAELCITRQIITAVKTATRQKHLPLNSYISLNKPVYDGESERPLGDMLDSMQISNPEEILIDKEEYSATEGEINKLLSKLEKQVLAYYMGGKSYVDIAKIMNRSEKSIDNALQRAKGKVEKYFDER